MIKIFSKCFFILLVLGITVSSCRKDPADDVKPSTNLVSDYDHDVALKWNELFLEVERYTPGYRPPVSARAMGYIGLTAYEALVSGMPDYNSLAGHYSGLVIPEAEEGREYQWEVVLNAAYARAFFHFAPTAPSIQQFRILSLERELNNGFEAEVSQEIFNRSVDYGRKVADAIYTWSKTDVAGHEAYLRNNDPNYVPPTGQGLWQPTYPDYLPALLPNWGQVRTFAANSDDSVRPPITYSEDPSSPFYSQARETQNLVKSILAGQHYEDRWIAEFWSDDCPILTFTPAGRWIAVANQVIKETGASLDFAIYAYAKLGMSLSDAGVRCWSEKYRYNLERPVDYIRRVVGDTNWNTIMCPDGSGNYFTPPFPSYPSGHATFGAAAAEVLTDLFGYDFPMTDKCHEGRVEFLSTPRSFPSFYAMAQENAYSRIPLGVHFRMDSEAGLTLGQKIGKKVNDLPWKN